MNLRAAATGFLLAVIVACASSADVEPKRSATIAYVNGHWYDGHSFAKRTAYVRDGVFVNPTYDQPTSAVDLAGGYILPAFAEGHHHTVLCNPPRIRQFIDAGILYAAIMNARVSTRACQYEMHGEGGVEIVNALAGVTAHNAHPSEIGANFHLRPDQVDGDWVYYVDTPADIDPVWARIEAHRPDFLKIFLSYSEDYTRLRGDPTISSWYRGLDPELVPALVARAHASGLKVAAHVMSGHDFQVAVESGVDIIAHMPGFAPGAAFTDNDPSTYLAALTPDSPRYRIAPEVARFAARRGVVVITTLSGLPPGTPPGASAPTNVRLLRKAGVTLLIGSDRGESNSVEEAIFLVEHNLLPPSEAVRALAVTTPRYFFPKRRIGDLSPGAEATFVVLRGNPLEDIHALNAPLRVVQRGRQIRPVTSE